MNCEYKIEFYLHLESLNVSEQNIIISLCNNIFNIFDFKSVNKNYSFCHLEQCFWELNKVVKVDQTFSEIGSDNPQEKLWQIHKVYDVSIRFQWTASRIEFLKFEIPSVEKSPDNNTDVFVRFGSCKNNFRMSPELKKVLLMWEESSSVDLSEKSEKFIGGEIANDLFYQFCEIQKFCDCFFEGVRKNLEHFKLSVIHIRSSIQREIVRSRAIVYGSMDYTLSMLKIYFWDFKVIWPKLIYKKFKDIIENNLNGTLYELSIAFKLHVYCPLGEIRKVIGEKGIKIDVYAPYFPGKEFDVRRQGRLNNPKILPMEDSYRICDSYDNDPSGDDSLQLEWDSAGKQWVEASNSFCSSVWPPPQTLSSARAYKVLLEHFGLTQDDVRFEDIIHLSPSELKTRAEKENLSIGFSYVTK